MFARSSKYTLDTVITEVYIGVIFLVSSDEQKWLFLLHLIMLSCIVSIFCILNLCLSWDAENNLLSSRSFSLTFHIYNLNLLWTWSLVCGVGTKSHRLLPLTLPGCPSRRYWKDCLILTVLWCYLVITQVFINMWVCFWTLNSAPFIYLTILMSILYCFRSLMQLYDKL